MLLTFQVDSIPDLEGLARSFEILETVLTLPPEANLLNAHLLLEPIQLYDSRTPRENFQLVTL